jgi:prepilin-type N-terminal cleavage/methylation domain-containing protein
MVSSSRVQDTMHQYFIREPAMLKGARGRRGFTLIETVVTVGIVATLAAVVVPQVVKQFDNADPTRLQSDLQGLQTAIGTFTVNLSGSVPGDLDDLANPLDNTGTIVGNNVDTTLTAAGAIDLFGSQASSWMGPYVDFGVVAGATKSTGFGSIIQHNFVCFIGSGTGVNTSGSQASQACSGTAGDSRLFLAIPITGLTTAQFEVINDVFDGTTEVDGSGATQSQSVGKVRLVSGVTYYLAAPLN